MNLYNQLYFDTMDTKKFYDELSHMPKWAIDEQLYNCEPFIEKERKSRKNFFSLDVMRAIIFWRAIVNF